MTRVLIVPVAGPKHKGTLFESGLIRLDSGEFTHVQHEKFMGKTITEFVEEEVKPAEATPSQSASKPNAKSKRKLN